MLRLVVIVIVALIALLGWAVMRSKRPADPIGAPPAKDDAL